MDKTRALTLFLGVVRSMSFSRAAVDAGLTPQAMSKAVRQLEEHLGVRLLHRTTRKLSLTDEGARLFELASPGVRLLDEALEQVQHSREEIDGLIRLSAPLTVGTGILVPLMREFQRHHPAARFDVLLEDHFTDLVDAKIDVGFRAGTTPERNVIARRLRELRMTICASPDYIAEHGKPTTLAQLLRHRCTGFKHPNTGRLVPWELEVDGSLVFQSVPVVASFNEVSAEIEAVRAGIGIGQLFAFMVEADIEAGTLIPLLPMLATARLSLFMYYPHREQLPLRVRRFIDFVVDASSGRQ